MSTKQFWIKLEEMLQKIPNCHVHMNTRIITKALLDEKDCKLHGHCIVYVGDQFLIKFHANIIEIFKMQFVVFLVRGFQMRFSPSRFYYKVNVIERSARQNPFEYKLQTSIG